MLYFQFGVPAIFSCLISSTFCLVTSVIIHTGLDGGSIERLGGTMSMKSDTITGLSDTFPMAY